MPTRREDSERQHLQRLWGARTYSNGRLSAPNMANYPHTGMSYDEMKKVDSQLTYRGDFEDDSPGDRFTRHMWEKDASKFDNPKFAEKVATKATSIEYSKNPEKALARAMNSVANRGSKALSNG